MTHSPPHFFPLTQHCRAGLSWVVPFGTAISVAAQVRIPRSGSTNESDDLAALVLVKLQELKATTRTRHMPHDCDSRELSFAQSEVDLNCFTDPQIALHHGAQAAFADVQADAVYRAERFVRSWPERKGNTEYCPPMMPLRRCLHFYCASDVGSHRALLRRTSS